MSNQLLTPSRTAVLGLILTAIVQHSIFEGAFYLDADDWFIIDMGRQVVESHTADQWFRFWSAEPTWRPLLTARSALEFIFFGTDPAPRLLVNLFIHVLCGWLVFALTRQWFKSSDAALWAALLYAAHPLHAEALTWFHSGFEGITVTFFMLLTLWSFCSQKATFVSLICFQLALFTRENALCIPLLVGAVAWGRALNKRDVKTWIVEAVPFLGLTLLNIGFRLWLIETAEHPPEGSFHFTNSLVTSVTTTFLHPWIPVHPAIASRTIFWGFWAGSLGALLILQVRQPKRYAWTAFIGFALAASAFIPNFYDSWRFLAALPGGYEQRWYFFHFPLAFLCLWPSQLIVHRFSARPAIGRSLLGLLLALSLVTWTNNALWYRQQSEYVLTTYETVDEVLKTTPATIGITTHEGLDSSELADQVFLNMPMIWPDAAQKGAAAYRQRIEGPQSSLGVSIRDVRGQVRWAPTDRIPKHTVWWTWDTTTNTLRRSIPSTAN